MLAGQRRFVFVVVNIVVAWSIRLGRSVSAFFDDRLRAVAGRAVILASWGCGNMRILRQLGKKGSCDMCV